MLYRLKNFRPLFAALLAVIAFARTQLPPTAQIPQPSPHAAAGVKFTDMTKAAGLGGFRFISGSPAKDYILEAPGAGRAFVDFDNDGWLDIYLVNGSTFDALQRR
jgi:hypothetical protein